jgi:hypothetical protein
MKSLGSVINLFKQKDSTDKREKELKSQGGRSIPERPILKTVALKSPCKKLGVCWSNACERVPGPGSGLGYQWSPSPPRPIHGLANAEPGMVGTGALVQNFAGASLHKLY